MRPQAPFLALAAVLAAPGLFAADSPVIRYAGSTTVTATADGGLRPVVGVENIQVVRANRTHPERDDGLNGTYEHAPMLAYWNGRFYLDFLVGPKDESQAPCSTSLTTSADGITWTRPTILFPSYALPSGEWTIMHQRTSFWVSPKGRLLATGFHGRAPEPNNGKGIGRVVREIRSDGTFGPIYFIRYNSDMGWNAKNTPYPFYTEAPDKGFVEACKAMLADKLNTEAWWEEDRSTDGFFSPETGGQAMMTYHRADGAVVGLWKHAQAALSLDNGHTWSPRTNGEGIAPNASKYWGQKTSDGLYALVYNPTTRLRFPLAILTGTDGQNFDGMLAVHGELPDQRFPGEFKNLGPQYVRGIREGDGVPPGGALWVTYSVNKEDIWISRIPVPITGKVTGPVDDHFASAPLGSMPARWNIYRPRWAPVEIVDSGSGAGHVLSLKDQDPYDYARAQRVFPETHGLDLKLRLQARQATGRLEVDLVGAHGARPVRLAFGEDGHFRACHEGIWVDGGSYKADTWITLEVKIAPSVTSDHAEVTIDGKEVFERAVVFAEPAKTVERLSLRTGVYRDRGIAGSDLPGADDKLPPTEFWVSDLSITPSR